MCALVRIVTKRVTFGELWVFPRTNAARQLTPDAERSAAGRFAFGAFLRNGLQRSVPSRGALRFFDRDHSGSEGNLQGSDRTPKSRGKTLRISG